MFKGVFVALFAIVVAAHAQEAAHPGRLALLTFDKSFDVSKLHDNGAHGELGEGVLQVISPVGSAWPGVMIKAPEGQWDLSAYEYISVDIHNIDTHDIDVYVRVDSANADGKTNSITERIGTQPDQRVTLTIPLKRISSSPIKLSGMNGYPQGLYPDKVGLDCSRITAIVPFTSKPETQCTFEISNVHAGGRFQPPTWLEMTPEEFFPFVDQFGQFKHRDWPGKTHSEAELIERRESEAAELKADAGPKQWNKWGGWASGPTLKATGHFRVEKHDGRWWFVDPDGKLFFSTGITCVGAASAGTPLEGRDNWFEGLPSQEDEAYKAFFSKSYKLANGKEPVMFNFSGMNLHRKYGADWRTVYPEVVHQRLRAWGLNTIGNWSDGNWQRMGRTPYTPTFFYTSRKLRNGAMNFPDPFAPEFRGAVLAGANQFLKGTFDDPWCIGYFLDNEMPWGGEMTLAQETLKSPADQPAKVEMIRWLKERYPAIADLNTAWAVALESWEALAADTKLSAKTPAAVADLTEFTERLAIEYFRTVRDVIKEVAPNKLYLGCRCVGGSNKVIAAAIEYCDVVSYNRYCHTVRDVKFPGGLDGPMLIGEFHFGAGDRGLFWNGLVSTENQADRAARYAAYVQSALDNPQIIGVHWFQYGDEAVTGRGDGENAQCGFVDVCDTPYVETVRSAREVAETMYERRAGGR